MIVKNLIFTVLVLSFTGMFYMGCEVLKEQESNTELEYTEYSLLDTDCRWINFVYDSSVIVVNSKKEMENYITCTEGSFSEIDFSKYTLLITGARTTHGINNLSKKLLLKDGKYILEVDITLNDAMIAEGWGISLIADKLDAKKEVKLKVTTIRN